MFDDEFSPSKKIIGRPKHSNSSLTNFQTGGPVDDGQMKTQVSQAETVAKLSIYSNDGKPNKVSGSVEALTITRAKVSVKPTPYPGISKKTHHTMTLN